MAKNYVQPGETITLIAPYNVSSGGGLLVGSIFGVALADAASGAPVEARRTDVFDLAKATGQSWTQGAKLYWDNTARNVTPTATSNTLIGAAAQAQASSDAVGRVLVTGQLA